MLTVRKTGNFDSEEALDKMFGQMKLMKNRNTEKAFIQRRGGNTGWAAVTNQQTLL